MATDDWNDSEQEDQRKRIERLKQRAEELTGEQMISMEADDCPLEIKEQFWKNVAAYEQAEQTTLFDRLVEAGVSLPSADEMDDSVLSAKLWEVFERLSLLGAFFHHTNHLSDRELYDHLWTDSLRESTILIPEDSDFTCHVDLIGSGSEEDNFIYMKYYANEDDRRQWAEEWPQDVLPEREQPPFDRDAYLPRPGSSEQNTVM